MSKRGTSRLNTYLSSLGTEALASLSWSENESRVAPPNERWTCICKIHGIERGRGVAPRKAAAKDDAADQAWAFLTGASEGEST
ncbi:hypothetical protein CVT24_003097 [Panaeolus cyanescens]|uniref:DRBM domain-containing protein n=1 Tax=Panaeolus cyanescens TaxID=181874 RepID=A0A409W1X7_9AGAR|nr:hypothetical protein CVT24_003097 [Panaeolus cyanescens]